MKLHANTVVIWTVPIEPPDFGKKKEKYKDAVAFNKPPLREITNSREKRTDISYGTAHDSPQNVCTK